MSTVSYNQRIRYIAFTEKEARLLKNFYRVVAPHVGDIVDVFHRNLELFPDAGNVISETGPARERLKASQCRYLESMFSGDYDELYFKSREKIGAIYSSMNMTPNWFVGAFVIYQVEINNLIHKTYWWRPKHANTLVNAITKLINLDIQVSLDSYHHSKSKIFSRTQENVEEGVLSYCNFIDKVIDGDLNQRLELSDNESLEKLGGKLNHMIEWLANMTTKIRTSSADTIYTLDEVRDAINVQSAGAAEQVAAVNETVSTLTQIKSTSAETLEKAQRLGEISVRSKAESEKGLSAMAKSIEGMTYIREKVDGIAHTILALSKQTQQIGDITEVVTSLAQQLKMLALNASIEAAKAGESGRGFGVVAEEVKELAEQSQQSTAQVQKILKDIRHATDRSVMATEEGAKGVDDGIKLIGVTGEAIRTLNDVINGANIASQQIVAAVRQEVIGIQQVNTAMSEINGVTGQFLSSANHTKEAADKLRDLAQDLGDSVEVNE